jgi:hypothetical protein
LDFGVRANVFNSFSAALVASESNAGGGAGRNSLGLASTHGCQPAAAGAIGFDPFQKPAPSGTVPLHLVSLRSALPRAIASAATPWPIARPADTSCGSSTPALSRDCIASSALAAKWPARDGKM